MGEQQIAEPVYSSAGVGEARTPDGHSFQFMRGTPQEAITARGNAVDQMKDVATSREPGLLPYLTRRLSAEYMMSSAILHSRDPKVKADLVRISVKQWLAEGNRSSAVNMLAYGKAADLDLPEYDEKFVYEQYIRSIEEGNPSDAYFIAWDMVLHRAKILPKTAYNSPNLEAEWVRYQQEALRLLAENVLNRIKQDPNDDSSLDMVFDVLVLETPRHKEQEEDPKIADLIKRVAQAAVGRDIRRGNPSTAIFHATMANMPEEYMNNLKRIVDPKVVEKLQDFGERLITNIAKLKLTGKKS